MAFPLLIGAYAALSGTATAVIGGIAAASTAIITYIVAKFTVKAAFVATQITVSVALIIGHFVMLGFFVYAIGFVFNKYNEFLSIMTDFSSSNELFGIALSIIQALGVINAFNDVFSIFSPYILAYLGYRVTLLVYHSYEATSNELFKVGVLTQQ